jgi:hypothetical protein
MTSPATFAYPEGCRMKWILISLVLAVLASLLIERIEARASAAWKPQSLVRMETRAMPLFHPKDPD